MLEKAEHETRSDRAVLCAKCEHLNERGTGECSRCGSHLYISCVDCGHRNERVRSRCTSCGRRLHRTLVQKLGATFLHKGLSLTPMQVFLFVFGVAIVFGVVVLVANFSLPTLF